jgi:hypothetical protein
LCSECLDGPKVEDIIGKRGEEEDVKGLRSEGNLLLIDETPLPAIDDVQTRTLTGPDPNQRKKV